MIITLDLTIEEIKKLRSAILIYHDEGPYGEGWQSELLINVSEKVLMETDKVLPVEDRFLR